MHIESNGTTDTLGRLCVLDRAAETEMRPNTLIKRLIPVELSLMGYRRLTIYWEEMVSR